MTRHVDSARQLVGLLPLILLSVLIALMATGAGPASNICLFQSPVSPLGTPETSPVTPLAPAEGSPAPPTATVEGPALVAVPTPTNLTPWVIGLLVTVIVVSAVLYWRRRREGGERSE